MQFAKPRSSKSFVPGITAAFVAVVLVASMARAQDYSIKMNRPDKVGDQYTTTIKSKFSRSVGANTESYTAELHGTVKVLAVNDKIGSATKIAITVAKATKDGNEFLPGGSVITAEKAGKETTFNVGDAPAEEDVKSVLNTLFDLSSPDSEVDADSSVGTDQPKKVGDTWPINAEMLAKDSVNSSPFPITAEQVKGQGKLLEVKKVDGVDVMAVKTDINVSVDHTVLQGANVSDLKIDMTVTGKLPVDKSLPAQSTTTSLKMKMNIVPPNAAAPVAFNATQEKTEERAPVKP